jgi:hypothetical protein
MNNKVKILLLAANPVDTSKLRLDEEVRDIYEALERAKMREQFEIIPQWAVRDSDLLHALVKHKPQIIHFSGHGAGDGGLALENDSGQTHIVSTEALTQLFKLFKEKINCVLLNACYSEAQAEAIHQHINYVIGMNQAIGDRAAIKFAGAFYQGLGNELSIEDAYELGRIAIQLAGIPESLTPVLKIKPKSPAQNQTSTQQEQKQDKPQETSPFSNLFNISNSTMKIVSGSGTVNYQESSS